VNPNITYTAFKKNSFLETLKEPEVNPNDQAISTLTEFKLVQWDIAQVRQWLNKVSREYLGIKNLTSQQMMSKFASFINCLIKNIENEQNQKSSNTISSKSVKPELKRKREQTAVGVALFGTTTAAGRNKLSQKVDKLRSSTASSSSSSSSSSSICTDGVIPVEDIISLHSQTNIKAGGIFKNMKISSILSAQFNDSATAELISHYETYLKDAIKRRLDYEAKVDNYRAQLKISMKSAPSSTQVKLEKNSDDLIAASEGGDDGGDVADEDLEELLGDVITTSTHFKFKTPPPQQAVDTGDNEQERPSSPAPEANTNAAGGNESEASLSQGDSTSGDQLPSSQASKRFKFIIK